MANDLNRCDFIGRLGSDPETKFLPSGGAVTNIRIACGWKTKEKEGTEWVPVVFFGRLAEVVAEYLRKGAQVYVSGRFQTRKWQDREGNDRYTTEIVADRMQMLGGKRAEQSASSVPSEGGAGGGFDDDIPFGPRLTD